MAQKLMLESREITATTGEIDLLSESQAAKFLNVTRVTLRDWVSDGLIRCKKQPIGERDFRLFEESYLARIKPYIPKNRTRGKHILSRELKEKIRLIR